jgi:transcriptional regulator with XRE-family HTH domain
VSEIGSYLKMIREEKRLSFREASERSGISHSYIRYIETGKRPGSNTPINPSPETLKRLSEAYNYPYPILMKVAGYIEDLEPLVEEEIDLKDINKLLNKHKILDLSDTNLIDFPMYYKGMELTHDEKMEFLAIARGIFDARQALKERK